VWLLYLLKLVRSSGKSDSIAAAFACVKLFRPPFQFAIKIMISWRNAVAVLLLYIPQFHNLSQLAKHLVAFVSSFS
jgi:hypothetical protein